MSGYLLDTDVISMLSPATEKAASGFLDWLERADRDGRIFLSVVTVHEIEKGIASLGLKGATAKASGLRDWLAGLIAMFGDRILDLDIPVASFSGRLEAQALATGHASGMADAMIAGIASAHDLTVVTRNTRHFRAFGIALLAPEDAATGIA